MENQEKEKFSYTYSAKEQEEVNRIRKKYVAEDNKLEQLRRLDAGVTEKATAVSIIVGVVGALVLGVGMCLTMGHIGSGTTFSFVAGIVIGVVGMIGMGVNYPIYKKILASGKQKYAFEIMELAKEISEQ